MSTPATARIALERLIVRSLITHLLARGWSPYSNDDGDAHVYCPTVERALDTVFSVDESRLHFAPTKLVQAREAILADKPKSKVGIAACDNACHAVLLIGGNGTDIISDWSFRDGDADGFSAAMNAFPDTEQLVARMTEAAPLMLDALELFMAQYDVHGDKDRTNRAEILAGRAAIAAAKGLA